ncbi:HAD-IC family P-type ATPase [Candidatus Saccharibacteria bacterium]|nr:HAD-IC family P-type ATPase [Candidatus Saccharibacteria bacterium]
MKFQGLSREDVRERVQAGQDNKPVKTPSKSVARVIIDNTFTYFNGVFAAIATVLILVESYRDLSFLGVILANTLIGIIQELRAKSALDKLNMLNIQKISVVREGKMETVPVNELVLDDVVRFKAGDQIPADAKVLDGNVAVNEALLTGEADEIQKGHGVELLSGSFVVSGECYAVLTRVRADSYISRLTMQAKAIKNGEQSEIIRSLNRIVRVAGIAIIPVGVLVYGQQMLVSHLPINVSVQGAASAVLGMIPEGLFLLASVSLAISVIRLAKDKVLVHEMKCIETLARVDVLCVDKTGTITSPDMKVREWVALSESKDTEELIAGFVASQMADNATMKALKKYFKVKRANFEAEKVWGFSSKYKYSAVRLNKKNYVLGAPEFVLGDTYGDYKKEIQQYTRKGYRVLVFGEYDSPLQDQGLDKPVKALAMIVLENPVRKTAVETFRYFREQGVKVKVISGDNVLTVAEVARQAQIEDADKYIDASTLTTDEQLCAVAEEYTVFGRVTPEQKRKLIKALQAKKHYVAMTGDGVNDILALKDADCSIAMASGSEAAVQAAQLVLLESDFSKMPKVVKEGRRVVNNLERSGSLFIVKNVFSFIAAILTLAFRTRYPMLPAQVSMLSVWAIGLPSFFLAQMPNENRIEGKFMMNILGKAIPAGIASVIIVFMALSIGRTIGIPESELSTTCTLAFGIVGLIYLYRICQPLNLYRTIVLAGCIIGLTVCFWWLGWAFSLSTEISSTTLLLCLGLGVLACPMLIFFPKLMRTRLEKFVTKIERK